VIVKENIWDDTKINLKYKDAIVTYEAKSNETCHVELIGAFSLNKNSFDEGDCDALTWTFKTDTKSFESFKFRTKMFEDPPEAHHH